MSRIIETKQKELLYVTIYDKLFKMITEGDFDENTRLPSEPKLAKKLGISRSTLRQSLSLLQDDGLIKNIRGKGNFIIKKDDKFKKGLEKIGNPIYKSLDIIPDELKLEFKIENPSKYYKKSLGDNFSKIVCIDRWYMKNNSTIAYTYTIISLENISEFNIDLKDKEFLKEFLEETIYNKCKKSNLSIKITTTGNFVTKNHPILNEETFFLLEEKLYFNSDFPTILNKHYIPTKNSYLTINQIK